MTRVDNRGVSVTVQYSLTLTITAILMGALLMGSGNILAGQQELTVETDLVVIGDRVVAGLMTADRLAQAGATEASVVVRGPDRVGGVDYSLTIEMDQSDTVIVVEPHGDMSSLELPVANNTPVETGSVPGGDVRVVLTPDGTLEVEPA